MVTMPEDGVGVYPATAPAVYEWVPFTSIKEMVLPVEVWVLLPTATDQFVPEGNPDSEKMREY
jgi:hypothetical protein